jgi:excisionase family DNA binding protein
VRRNNPPTPARRDYESLRSASERMSIAVYTLREKIAAGELPAYRFSDKPGAELRVRVADVDALMKPLIPQAIYADRQAAGGAA